MGFAQRFGHIQRGNGVGKPGLKALARAQLGNVDGKFQIDQPTST